jgi:hypothetical protein
MCVCMYVRMYVCMYYVVLMNFVFCNSFLYAPNYNLVSTIAIETKNIFMKGRTQDTDRVGHALLNKPHKEAHFTLTGVCILNVLVMGITLVLSS